MKLYEIQRKRIDLGKVEVGFGTTDIGTFLKFPDYFSTQTTGEKVVTTKARYTEVNEGLCVFERKHSTYQYEDLSYDELFEELPKLFPKPVMRKGQEQQDAIALCSLVGVVNRPTMGGFNRYSEQTILVQDERYIQMMMLYDQTLSHSKKHRHMENFTFPFGLVVKGGDGRMNGVVEGLRTLYAAKSFYHLTLTIYQVSEIILLR